MDGAPFILSTLAAPSGLLIFYEAQDERQRAPSAKPSMSRTRSIDPGCRRHRWTAMEAGAPDPVRR